MAGSAFKSMTDTRTPVNMNRAPKYEKLIQKEFFFRSFTAPYVSNKFDWNGYDSIKVWNLGLTDLKTYSLDAYGNGNGTGGNRYGEPEDLSDSLSEYRVDKHWTLNYIIDEMDEQNQMHIKRANERLQAHIDMKVTPMLDKYNLRRWIHGAGSVVVAGANDTIYDMILDATVALDNAAVPQEGRTLFVSAETYKEIKLLSEFDGIDKKAVIVGTGHVGNIDGMNIVRIPAAYWPKYDGTNVPKFFVMHKDACCAPTRFKEYRTFNNLPNVCGTQVQGLGVYDAFVFENKCPALCVGLPNGAANYRPAAPTVTAPTRTGTVTNGSIAPVSGASKNYYVVVKNGQDFCPNDDPRWSGKRVEFSSTVTIPSTANREFGVGDTIYVVAYVAKDATETNGKFMGWSVVSSTTI